MEFAEDEVKKYIKNNLGRFHRRITVCQMLDYLPCLTDTDKQQIRADVERKGNNDSVWGFFDHLQRRRDWVKQLLNALHETNLGDIAEKIQRVYQDNQAWPPNRSPASRAPLVPDGSQAVDSNHPPSDVCQRSLHNALEPGRIQPPLPNDVPRPVLSTPDPPLQYMGDYGAPIQETKHPSSSPMVVKPKNAGNVQKPDSSTPIQKKSEISSEMSLLGGKQPDDQVTLSCVSPNEGQLGMVPMDELPPTTPVNSRYIPGNLVQNWDSHQHHPVHVKNERFRSMNHQTDNSTRSLPKGPEQTVSPYPGTSENQPEEDYYLTSDSSLLTPNSQDGTQDRVPLNPQAPSTMPCKSPVQATEPSSFGMTTPRRRKEEVTQPSRNIACDTSRTYRICDTNEEDDAPLKPGVLLSYPSGIQKFSDTIMNSDPTNPAYSGDSDRLCISTYSGNDPLMVSEPSRNGLSEERCSDTSVSIGRGRSETSVGTSPSSAPSENGSVRVLQGKIVQPPSFDLTDAPDADLRSIHRTLGPLPDSVPDHQQISSASSHPGNSDTLPNKKVADETPSLLGNAVWPAVGLALSLGFFVLLRWLKK